MVFIDNPAANGWAELGKSRQGNRASEQQGTKSSRHVVHRLFFPLKYTALNVGPASKLNLIKEGL